MFVWKGLGWKSLTQYVISNGCTVKLSLENDVSQQMTFGISFIWISVWTLPVPHWMNAPLTWLSLIFDYKIFNQEKKRCQISAKVSATVGFWVILRWEENPCSCRLCFIEFKTLIYLLSKHVWIKAGGQSWATKYVEQQCN